MEELKYGLTSTTIRNSQLRTSLSFRPISTSLSKTNATYLLQEALAERASFIIQGAAVSDFAESPRIPSDASSRHPVYGSKTQYIGMIVLLPDKLE